MESLFAFLFCWLISGICGYKNSVPLRSPFKIECVVRNKVICESSQSYDFCKPQSKLWFMVLLIRWPKYWSFSFSMSPSRTVPLGLIDLISLQFKGLSRVFSNTTVQSISSLALSFLYGLLHPYMTSWKTTAFTGKTIALTRQTFVGKVMSLLFNMLSRLLIDFLARRQHFLISWLQSPSAVILEPKKIKPFTVSPSICHEVITPVAMIFVFLFVCFF